MAQGFSEVARLHSRLHEDAAALFRALDDDTTLVYIPFSRFIHDVDLHLRTDLTIGYRLFLRHPSESVRRIAEHVLRDQEVFPRSFESFRARWYQADEAQLRSLEFRDEVETLVSQLLKRIRVEEKLVSMLSSVA
ncbi:MAG TPA: hypothetical protein VFN49_09245 [Candidatus Aquilonibacter sp.]|nr:hypothetical protein [Candidatus Aquilonibacter sp.]